MSRKQLVEFMRKEGLRQVDVGWLCGRSKVQVCQWGRRNRVPQAAALLLMAIDEGLLPYEWFKSKIKTPIPD